MRSDVLSRRQLVVLGLSAAMVRPGWVGQAGRWSLRPGPRPSVGSPTADRLGGLVAELTRKHGIPGAVVGLLENGRVTTAAAGVANLNTGVPMTPDTAFLTGSITKVWTAALMMTLVDEGRLQLDRPVQSYLPGFTLGEAAAARVITARQLLNHSSGIDAGDYLLELGEGRTAHRRYVEALRAVGQIHAPGAYSSYCNGGFILAGYLAEELTDTSFDDLLRARLIEPLGLTRTEPSRAPMTRSFTARPWARCRIPPSPAGTGRLHGFICRSPPRQPAPR